MIRAIVKKYIPYHSHVRSLEMKIVKDYLPVINSIMLDGGIGDGVFSSSLSQRFTIIGLDINPDEIKKAKGNRIICDLAKIPIRNESVHLILSNSVMEHVPLVKDAMNEFGRVAKKRAIMILTFPTDTDGQIVRKVTRVVYQVYHNLKTSEWWELISSSGFKMEIEVRYEHKLIHNLYILSCVFIPLLLFSNIFIAIIKRLPEDGVNVCLVSRKI